VCDTKVGRGVPLLETREKSHFMRIDEHEWAICRAQLIEGFHSDAAATTKDDER
jgi:transketolase